MQQTIASTHFPKGKLQRLTQKVTKLLSQKYKFDTTQKTGGEYAMKDIRLRHEDIQAAMQKTEKMNTKLKLIRTMLGYQYQTLQKKQKAETIDNLQQKRLENKGENLKQFVMSMRKRNELTDKYFRHRRTNSIDQNHLTFDAQSKKIQEYTDASLKYVHSFLPHQTTIEKPAAKGKRSFELVTLTPQREQYHSPQSDSPCNVQDSHSESIQVPYVGQQNEGVLLSAVRNKKSYSLAPNYNTPNAKKSFLSTIEQRSQHDISKFGLAERKESISLPIVHHESPHEKQPKMSNNTAPLEICANRVTDSIYRGKHHTRDLKHILRGNRSDKLLSSPEKQPNKALNQLFPVIKQCIPETRKQGNVPSP